MDARDPRGLCPPSVRRLNGQLNPSPPPSFVVTRIYPSAVDFENLSRLRTESSDEADRADFSGVVVVKPWGYEYLWLQNPSVAVWVLHLNEGRAKPAAPHLPPLTAGWES